MHELLDKYKERFGEQFPLMLCRMMTDDEISDIINRCLVEGKPYSPELDVDSNY